MDHKCKFVIKEIKNLMTDQDLDKFDFYDIYFHLFLEVNIRMSADEDYNKITTDEHFENMTERLENTSLELDDIMDKFNDRVSSFVEQEIGKHPEYFKEVEAEC
jgi:hypothetical protein